MNKIAIASVIASITAFTAVVFMPIKVAEAREICFTQYGGGETCIDESEDSKLKVDKKIYNPKSGDYEDHIKAESGSNPYTFTEGEEIKFKFTVKNDGDVDLVDVEAEDILPSYLKYEGGDGDENDEGDKIGFDIGDLDVGESKTFEFTAEIADDGILPNDDMVCLTNIVKAEGKRKDHKDEKEEAVDYANFCIDLPEVLGKETIKVLPTTGGLKVTPEQLMIGSIASGLVLVGFGIKQFADS